MLPLYDAILSGIVRYLRGWLGTCVRSDSLSHGSRSTRPRLPTIPCLHSCHGTALIEEILLQQQPPFLPLLVASHRLAAGRERSGWLKQHSVGGRGI